MMVKDDFVELIHEERREAARYLLLMLSNALNKQTIGHQTVPILNEITQIATLGGFPLEKIAAIHLNYQKIFQKPSISKIQQTRYMREAIEDYLALLNDDALKTELPNEIVQNVIIYLQTHYVKEIKLEEISKTVNMSLFRLCHIFKKETGMSIGQFLTDYRLLKAKSLLKDTEHNIKKISYQVGYRDPSYFSRTFRKNTGLAPSEYRQLIKKKAVSSSAQLPVDAPTRHLALQRLFQNSLPPVVYRTFFFYNEFSL